MKAIINARIYDYQDYIETGYIIYDGAIKSVGSMEDFDPSGIVEIIDVKNNLVIPGFVAGHTHLYSAFARGMSVPFDPKSFQDILEQLWWKLDHFLDKEMIYYSAFSSGLEQLRCGSTTLIDHHASHEVIGTLEEIRKALCDDLNMRAILAFETSDRFDVDQSIQENSDFMKRHIGPKCAGLFGLHASFTLSENTLGKVKKALNGGGIHIHVAESLADEQDSQEKYGESVVERLDRFGLLDENSVLVHCANATEAELDLISSRGSVIALNPSSNMNNAVGLPDFAMMQKKGIRVMIGNDGLIQSMPLEYMTTYYTSHLKTGNPVGLSLDAIKQAIDTSNQFAGKRLGVSLGRISSGYEADLISFPYTGFTPITKDNIFGHLFFGAFPNLKPEYVIAGGQLMVDHYEISEKLMSKNQESVKQAEKLWKRIAKEGKQLGFKY